ncbi:MAG TPA: formylglycine-generating enzyme family protein [Gemmataceae bacterium]|nr:formylglycine-generating enzyme family protein [Gemmataceae bacterium]
MVRLSLVALVAVLASTLLAPPHVDAQGKEKKADDEVVIGGVATKFVKVPKGTFWMGWSNHEWITKPPRQSKLVDIERDFEMAACHITQRQWEKRMGKNPSWHSRQGGGKEKVKGIVDAVLGRFPVEMVSYDDAQAFLMELNKQEKDKGWHYRLPTQAEFEYACREAATSKEDCSSDFYFGKRTNDITSKDANISGAWIGGKIVQDLQLFRPESVGSKKPNKLGLYDMQGNVRQWCDKEKGAGCPNRGGCFSQPGYQAAAAYHQGYPRATDREYDIGVRLVRVRTQMKK